MPGDENDNAFQQGLAQELGPGGGEWRQIKNVLEVPSFGLKFPMTRRTQRGVE